MSEADRLGASARQFETRETVAIGVDSFGDFLFGHDSFQVTRGAELLVDSLTIDRARDRLTSVDVDCYRAFQ